MELNHFIAAEAVTEKKCVMINREGDLVFSGPLSAVTLTHFNQATKTFVHPLTFQWIKDEADKAIRAGKVRL